MISVTRIGHGMVSYLSNRVREDYYFEGGEEPGTWQGSACRQLGCVGIVRREDLRAMTRGFSPDGRKLVRNAGKCGGRRARHLGISYVFNAPKSFSVAWAFACEEMRAQLQAAFDRAVRRTIIEYIEPEIAHCRLKDGTEVPAKVAASQHNHIASRAGDMHYHAHVLFPSEGVCPDGSTRALVSAHFYDRKLDVGAYFRSLLEHECRNLGLEFHRPVDAKGELKSYTELKIVPEEVCRHFSKRRQKIDASLQSKGTASAQASAVATLETRPEKEVTLPRPVLLAQWLAEAEQNGLSLDWTRTITSPLAPVHRAREYARALRHGRYEATRQESHFQAKDILRETFVAVQGRGGVDPLFVYKSLREDLEKSPKFLNLGIRNGVHRYTTPELNRVEQEMLGHVDHMIQAPSDPVPAKIVRRAAEKERRVTPSTAKTPVGKLYDATFGDKRTYRLDAEQQECVEYVTRAPGKITAICGIAGTSKTTVTAAIAEAYRKDGWKVFGTALAGNAAKNLEEKTGVPSDTVRMTLMRLYPTTAQLAEHHVTQLCRAARGRRTYQFDRLTLDSRSVLFVDEASMVGTRDMALLVKACDQAHSKMVLIGDERQLPAIEQGGAFGSILHRAGGFELTQNKRQYSVQEKDRVERLSRGETEDVLNAYADDRKLFVAPNHAKAQDKLIEDWVRRGGVDAPKDHAILAPTHIEIGRLNDLAQQERMRAGKLATWQSVTVGDETFYRGDRVRFTQISRKHHLQNGDRGTIISIANNPALAAIRVRLDGENSIRNIPLRTLLRTEYNGLTRGYAMSVHAAQGCSVEHTYCHLSGKMLDRELAYVALSRHRDSVHIYTDENHAGVALTNRVRQALGDPNQLHAKPGLPEEYSPLLQQISKSRMKTLAADHKEPPAADQKASLAANQKGPLAAVGKDAATGKPQEPPTRQRRKPLQITLTPEP